MAADSPLASTELGGKWVANFLPEDRLLAESLLGKIRSVTYGQMRAGLIAKVEQVLSEDEVPTVLFPARQPRLANDSPEWLRDPVHEPDTDRPFDGDEGSEVVIANLLRDIRIGVKPRRKFTWTYLSLEQMRSRKVRRVILVDDYAGSGSKATECLDAWTKNPTIRSWISFGWLRLDYVLYAASNHARAIVERSIRKTRGALHAIELARDFDSSFWLEGEYEAATNLCTRYAHNKSQALGWAESMGLTIFAHKTPNNLPAVFTQSKGPNGRPWTPLVKRRKEASRHPDMNDRSYTPLVPLTKVAAGLGQTRLAESELLGHDDFRARMLVALGAIVRHKSSPEYLADVLKTSQSNAASVLLHLKILGLIDSTTGKLTDAGWEELRYARSTSRRPQRPAVPDLLSVYYPQALRRGGDV